MVHATCRLSKGIGLRAVVVLACAAVQACGPEPGRQPSDDDDFETPGSHDAATAPKAPAVGSPDAGPSGTVDARPTAPPDAAGVRSEGDTSSMAGSESPGGRDAGVADRPGQAADGAATSADGSATAVAFPPKGQCFPSTMLRGPLPVAPVGFPSALLDLSSWKITLPVDDDLNCGRSGKAKEVKQPLLQLFQDERFFFADQGGWVVFRAGVSGITTTSNSAYPRSELREAMSYDPALGPREASWGVNDGKTHTMTITQSITQVPIVKREVVVGQIHDASDDLIMVRLEVPKGSDTGKLFIESKGSAVGTLNGSYELGTRFTVKIEAGAGNIRVYYDDMNTPKVQMKSSATGCYFKSGIYVQSNLSRGEDPKSVGEVRIYDLTVRHM